MRYLPFLILFNLVVASQQISFYEKIYETLSTNDIHFCTRKLDKWSQFGCSTKFNGNTGALVKLDTYSQVSKFVRSNKEDSIVIVPDSLFVNTKAMDLLIYNSASVAGLTQWKNYMG